jgi:hypothetical protein
LKARPGCGVPCSPVTRRRRSADLYAKGGKLPPNYAEAAMWSRRAAEDVTKLQRRPATKLGQPAALLFRERRLDVMASRGA